MRATAITATSRASHVSPLPILRIRRGEIPVRENQAANFRKFVAVSVRHGVCSRLSSMSPI